MSSPAAGEPGSPEPTAADPDPTDETLEPVAKDSTAKDGAAEDTGEKEWWDDPRMPWKGKPGRADIGCWVGFSLTGLYYLVLLPLRPVLLGLNPYLLAALGGGSRTTMVTIGALTAIGQGNWVLGLVLGTFGAVKFDWLYWWAGRLWGRGLIEVIAGRSPRAARNAARAERLAGRYGALAVVTTFVIPLPGPVVYASVAAAGMSLRRFLLWDIVGAVTTRAIYLYLGYKIGQPAVDVVEVIAKYSLWISVALIVGIIVNAWRQSRRAGAARTDASG